MVHVRLLLLLVLLLVVCLRLLLLVVRVLLIVRELMLVMLVLVEEVRIRHGQPARVAPSVREVRLRAVGVEVGWRGREHHVRGHRLPRVLVRAGRAGRAEVLRLLERLRVLAELGRVQHVLRGRKAPAERRERGARSARKVMRLLMMMMLLLLLLLLLLLHRTKVGAGRHLAVLRGHGSPRFVRRLTEEPIRRCSCSLRSGRRGRSGALNSCRGLSVVLAASRKESRGGSGGACSNRQPMKQTA